MKQIRLAIPVGLIVAVAALSFESLWGPAFGQDRAAKTAVKWEYKVIQYNSQTLEDSLNKLGEDGWDFAGAVSGSSPFGNPFGGGGGGKGKKGGGGGGGFSTDTPTVIMKRPK